MNFREWLEEKARLMGEAPFLYFKDRVISYREMDRLTNKAAHMFLNLGLKKGDKCTIILDNRPEYLWAWFGLAKIGAVAACLNRHLRGDALRYLIDISDSKAIFLDAQLKDFYEDVEHSLSKVQRVIWYPTSPT